MTANSIFNNLIIATLISYINFRIFKYIFKIQSPHTATANNSLFVMVKSNLSLFFNI